MRNPDNLEKTAVVRFVGNEQDYKQFTKNQCYEAFFLEYWQGVRNSLHVKNNKGEIVDFIPFEEFEVVSDEGNVLNNYTATVRCITHKFDDSLLDIKYGKTYLAIGRDKNGMFLVKDESHDCYFYLSSDFEIIEDEHGILSRESVYYSFNG